MWHSSSLIWRTIGEEGGGRRVRVRVRVREEEGGGGRRRRY